jgi:hypothetical protein
LATLARALLKACNPIRRPFWISRTNDPPRLKIGSIKRKSHSPYFTGAVLRTKLRSRPTSGRPQ